MNIRNSNKNKSSLSCPIVLAIVFAYPVVAAHQETDHGIEFVDVSQKLLVSEQPPRLFVRELGPFIHQGDRQVPASDGVAGAAWIDRDNDGDLDLFLTNGPGGANVLFENKDGNFLDIAADAGVAGDMRGFSGALAADYDNDGCTDLLLTGTGGFLLPHNFASDIVLYHNNCGEELGIFTDVTDQAGLSTPEADQRANTLMAAFGDINNDGFLDLFVTVTGSFADGFINASQRLYLNNGDGSFTNISQSAGVDTMHGGCVVGFFDHDNDGWQDIIVGNCNDQFIADFAMFPIPGTWELWRNNGNNTFTDIADATGLNVRPGFPMSMTIADYDNDGDFDIFATGFGVKFSAHFGIMAEQVLFENNGDGTYSDATFSAGLGNAEFGWGGSFADFDNDGDQDLMVVGSMPFIGIVGPGVANPGSYYDNDGFGHFERTLTFGLDFDFTSGLAIGDFNGNGFQDALIVKSTFSATGLGIPLLLENNGNGNNSLQLRLIGTDSNRGGIGAVVKVATKHGKNDRSQVQLVQAGTSLASTNSPYLTFGVGKSKKAKIEVTWPSGRVETFQEKHLKNNGDVRTLIEGTGEKTQ